MGDNVASAGNTGAPVCATGFVAAGAAGATGTEGGAAATEDEAVGAGGATVWAATGGGAGGATTGDAGCSGAFGAASAIGSGKGVTSPDRQSRSAARARSE